MCFQGYVHCSCGHTLCYDEECEYAQGLDVNFWLKVDCPYYNIQSLNRLHFCSRNKYYCKQTPDGHYLDTIHERRDEAQQQFEEANKEIHERWAPIPGKRLKQWLSKGGTKDSFVAAHGGHVRRVQSIIADLTNTKNVAQQTMVEMDFVINQATRLFENMKQQALALNLPLYPTPLPASLCQPQEQQRLLLQSTHGKTAWTFNNMNSLVLGDQTPDRAQQAANFITSQPRHLEAISGELQVESEGRAASLRQQQRAGSQDSLLEVVASSKKRRRGSKKVEGQIPPQEPSTSVRRSARVREKKVNYADLEFSDVATSRSVSPQKSDVSAFSPSRSDVSVSPKKGLRGRAPKKDHSGIREALFGGSIESFRSSDSLIDKIGDWRRRNINFGLPDTYAKSPPKDTFQVLSKNVRRTGQKRKLDEEGFATPDTIILPEKSQSEGRLPALSLDRQGSMTKTPPAKQTWSVSRYDRDPTAGSVEILDLYEISPLQSLAALPDGPSFDYEQLRESFNADVDFKMAQGTGYPPVPRSSGTELSEAPSKRLHLPSQRSIITPQQQGLPVARQGDTRATPSAENSRFPGAPILLPTPVVFQPPEEQESHILFDGGLLADHKHATDFELSLSSALPLPKAGQMEDSSSLSDIVWNNCFGEEDKA